MTGLGGRGDTATEPTAPQRHHQEPRPPGGPVLWLWRRRRAKTDRGRLAHATVAEPAFTSWQWRAGNALVSLLACIGIGPIQILTTRDRRTGHPHTNPVVPVEHNGAKWLVAPYGVVTWVRNARADERVRLQYGRTTRDYIVREVGPDEAAPVLKRYVAVATKTRSRFRATKDSPTADFALEAASHPVFELVERPSNASPPGDPASGG